MLQVKERDKDTTHALRNREGAAPVVTHRARDEKLSLENEEIATNDAE